MENKTYDVLKIVALLILPLSEFVSAMASIWGFQHGQEIVATLVAFNMFLGAVLKISSDNYHAEEGK